MFIGLYLWFYCMFIGLLIISHQAGAHARQSDDAFPQHKSCVSTSLASISMLKRVTHLRNKTWSCRLPTGRGLREAALAPGRNETRVVNPLVRESRGCGDRLLI